MKTFEYTLLVLLTFLVSSRALIAANADAPTPAPTSGDDILVQPTNVTIDKGAVCLSGNPAVYYHSEGFGKGVNNWMVYLREGGWCMNVSDCKTYILNKGVGTAPTTASFVNLLSNQKEENPDFFNWNRVVIRYCDASSFTGDSEVIENGTKLHFRGARIFKAVMQELVCKGMGNAENALLAGSSAGGVATAIYCDRFRNFFSPTARVKCLSDAGYFFLSESHTQKNTFLSMFDGLIKLHGSENALPKSCTSRLSAELCFFPQNLVADIETPIFFLMSAFDKIQIQYTMMSTDFDACINGRNCSLNQIKIMQDLRFEFLTILPKECSYSQKGVLITHPYAHTQVLTTSWYSPVAGTKETMAEIFREWYFDGKDTRVIDQNPCPYYGNCSLD